MAKHTSIRTQLARLIAKLEAEITAFDMQLTEAPGTAGVIARKTYVELKSAQTMMKRQLVQCDRWSVR